MFCKIRVTCLTCKSRFELSSSHFQLEKCVCPSCKSALSEVQVRAICDMMNATKMLPTDVTGFEGEQKFVFAFVTDGHQDIL